MCNTSQIKKDKDYKVIKPEIVANEEHVYINKMSKEKQTWEIDVNYEGQDLAYRDN